MRVLCVHSLHDPLVVGGLADRELVIGLDHSSVRLAGSLCAGAQPPSLVSLRAEVGWQDAYGSPLLPLPAFLATHLPDVEAGSPGTGRPSALRQCALLARLLALPATTGRDRGRTAFELLLLAHAGRFEDSFRGWRRDAS